MSAFTTTQLDDLERLDWDDLAEVQRVTRPILERLASDRAALTDLVEVSQKNGDDHSAWELTDHFARLILARSKRSGARLILLSMNQNDRNIVHNHRASFTTMILNSGYGHYIYGYNIRHEGQKIETKDLQPISFRNELAGSIYSIHHSSLHSTRPLPNHLSLIVRGPSVLDSRVVIDPNLAHPEWVNGGSDSAQPRDASLTVDASRVEWVLEAIRG
ncbi:MAG: hypothetical protein AAGG50_08565 [Bacteroidota bacterium]